MITRDEAFKRADRIVDMFVIGVGDSDQTVKLLKHTTALAILDAHREGWDDARDLTNWSKPYPR